MWLKIGFTRHKPCKRKRGRAVGGVNGYAPICFVAARRQAEINALLSEFGDYIIGRMGLPYKQKGVSVISVVLDAPTELINKLTGVYGKYAHICIFAFVVIGNA